MAKLKSSLVIILLTITGLVFGQTYEDVVAKFNEGADDINKGEFSTAIMHLQEVIAMAENVGAEANDLVSKSKDQIPVLNYQVAIGYMKQKDYENAIPYLEKTVDLAEAYGNNEEYKSKAMKYLPKLLTGVGTQKLKSEDMSEAKEMFEHAIKYAPNYSKGYLGLGLVYKSEYEEEEMIYALTKAIELAKAKNDAGTIEDAQKGLGDYFVELGDSEMEEMEPEALEFDYAIEYYEQAIEYHPTNPDAHYKMALISNRLENFEAAINHAKIALENETVEIKIAAISYELGSAYYSSAELDLACETFKNSLVGVFEERTQKKMEKIPGCTAN